MDKALYGDEPLIDYIIVYYFLVFDFEFFCLQRYCTKVALLCIIGATLLQYAIGCWQPSSKIITGCKRVLAALCKISHRVSEVIGNPLTNSSEGIDTFAKSTYLPEGCQHPLFRGQRVLITLQSSCQRVLDKLYRHFFLQESCPSNKKGGNLFAIPLKKTESKNINTISN